ETMALLWWRSFVGLDRVFGVFYFVFCPSVLAYGSRDWESAYARPAGSTFTNVQAIRSDPNLFHASCEIQLEKLIIEPCSKIEAEWGNLPNTIVIDGLDECVHLPSQERLLTLIQKVTTAHRALKIPVPWTFLVCSRPEPQIRDAFDNFHRVLRHLDVNSSDDAFRDIKQYFIDQFAILRAKHHRSLPRGGVPWPRADAIDELTGRAQGQFIFAATVIKFIDTRDESPQDRLDAVLRIYVEHGSDSPYSDLDLLYCQILSTCQRWGKVQLDASWRSVTIIEGLLNLEQGDDMSDITVAHASFTEFLQSTVNM
ncbi:hypothetical protein MPER_06172, partial [Moniliophthora perniciosa FA553]